MNEYTPCTTFLIVGNNNVFPFIVVYSLFINLRRMEWVVQEASSIVTNVRWHRSRNMCTGELLCWRMIKQILYQKNIIWTSELTRLEKESINLLSKNNVIVHSELISIIGEDFITLICTNSPTFFLELI